MNETDRSWRSAEREQRRRSLRLSFRQRLDWLWNAKLFAARALAAAKARKQQRMNG